MSAPVLVGANPLAKKRSARSKSSPEQWESKPTAINLRGSPEWKQWVKDLAQENRQDVSVLIDMLLARYAKETGFRNPPER